MVLSTNFIKSLRCILLHSVQSLIKKRQFTLGFKLTLVFGKNINWDFALFLHKHSLRQFFRLEKKVVGWTWDTLGSQICLTTSIRIAHIMVIHSHFA